jgi:hypothetical protein
VIHAPISCPGRGARSGAIRASWFETRGCAALLTMGVESGAACSLAQV